MKRLIWSALCVAGLLWMGLAGCDSKTEAPKTEAPRAQAPKDKGEVVIYFSIDEPYATPLLKQFEQETGIKVVYQTDTEATKTAALVERIEAEKDNPKADVYWGNEIFHTLNLKEKGIFQAYRPTTAEDVPARWRDKGDLYTCLGLRAREIIVSTRPEHAAIVSSIHGLEDLGNPALKDKVGICNPAFGTASGHFAAMYILWGPEKYTKVMQSWSDNNIALLGGNSAVADQVASGTLIAGPTDNDDVDNAKAEDQKVESLVPDQGEKGIGTLLVPGTISLMNKAPHADNGKKLIDFLMRPEIEKKLIEGRYLAYSVRDTSKVKPMDVDYEKCAKEMKTAVELALKILQKR